MRLERTPMKDHRRTGRMMEWLALFVVSAGALILVGVAVNLVLTEVM